MRVQRVVLEHHRAVAIFRLEVIDDPVSDADRARADLFEARDHSQQRRLSASRRSHQHDELAIGDRDVDAMYHLQSAIAFANIDEFDRGHLFFCLHQTFDEPLLHQ